MSFHDQYIDFTRLEFFHFLLELQRSTLPSESISPPCPRVRPSPRSTRVCVVAACPPPTTSLLPSTNHSRYPPFLHPSTVHPPFSQRELTEPSFSSTQCPRRRRQTTSPGQRLSTVSRGATRGNQGAKGSLGTSDATGRALLQLRVQARRADGAPERADDTRVLATPAGRRTGVEAHEDLLAQGSASSGL